MFEIDPNGLAAHDPGSKLDAGKVRVGLMFEGFSRALLEVAKVTTMGAAKYTPRGWESVPNGIERYTDAMDRHHLYELQGEMYDPESHLLHAAHLAWNALARLELMQRKISGFNLSSQSVQPSGPINQGTTLPTNLSGSSPNDGSW